jgi:uncharacterized protein YbaR (Trm112 family)
LGVAKVEEIVTPPATAEVAAATDAQLGESHVPVTVAHICPLCGAMEAYSYEGHGGVLVCAVCKKAYDPSCE